MSFVLGLLLVAAQQPVERHTGVIAGAPVRYEPAIAPALDEYQRCLTERRIGPLDPDAATAFERSFQQCTDARTRAIARADELLRAERGWSSAPRREATINATFDALDAADRAAAARLDAMIKGRAGH